MFIVHKVRFKNFKSFGNQWTEVELTRNGTTVITGKNGVGKTSILHSIEFGLFGKVVGINKPSLINDTNAKDCLVEVFCEKGGQQILIRRGMKPNIFDIEIDGVMIDQSASSRDYQQWLEETVLGFNLNSFRQVVSISGSGYTPFFMLTTGQRRKMVDDLLDITVFSKMHAIHGGELNALRESLRDVEKDIEKYEAAISSLKKGIDELSNRDADIRGMVLAQIESFKQDIEKYRGMLESLDESERLTEFSAIDLKKLQTKLTKMQGISRDMETTQKSGAKFIKFMTDNTTCPTCTSELTEEFRKDHICKKESKNEEITSKRAELQSMINDAEASIEEMIRKQTKLSSFQRERERINGLISQTETNIKFEEKKLKRTESSSESTLTTDLIKKTALLDEAKERRTELLVERQYAELKVSILKDSGIKSRIVTRTIPRMTKDINRFLQLLQLDAKFEIDENFNETIYRRFTDPVTYPTFSAGERARIDIAVLFTWREIAKAKNSLSCNLLFLDEIFDNVLDEEGLELFISLLKNNMPGTNVFLISHKSEVIDKFESNLRIDKRRGFGYIV